jgi:hypothetical protein
MNELQKTTEAVRAYEAEFDQALEQEFGTIWIADKPFTAGEILKALDPKTYRTGLSEFFVNRLAQLLEESN